MTKERKTLLIIYAVSVAVFLTIFFAVPFEKKAASWVAFSFGVLSIIVGCCVSLYATNDGKNLQSKVYGFPMFRLGYYYTIAQIIVSFVIIIIASTVGVPAWIPIVVGVILLAVVIAGAAAVDTAKDYIVQQEIGDVEKTKTVETFRVDIDSLVRKCSDDNMKKELEKLAEEFKYSDPVSNKETHELEIRISALVSDLNDAISSDSVDGKIISSISDLLRERNMICKRYKS